jgi:hypothetical protein
MGIPPGIYIYSSTHLHPKRVSFSPDLRWTLGIIRIAHPTERRCPRSVAPCDVKASVFLPPPSWHRDGTSCTRPRSAPSQMVSVSAGFFPVLFLDTVSHPYVRLSQSLPTRRRHRSSHRRGAVEQFFTKHLVPSALLLPAEAQAFLSVPCLAGAVRLCTASRVQVHFTTSFTVKVTPTSRFVRSLHPIIAVGGNHMTPSSNFSVRANIHVAVCPCKSGLFLLMRVIVFSTKLQEGYSVGAIKWHGTISGPHHHVRLRQEVNKFDKTTTLDHPPLLSPVSR